MRHPIELENNMNQPNSKDQNPKVGSSNLPRATILVSGWLRIRVPGACDGFMIQPFFGGWSYGFDVVSSM